MTAHAFQAALAGPEAVTPAQVKAARRLLRWSISGLAARSRTTLHLVRTYECSGRVAVSYFRMSLADPVAAIRAALEEAGIEFTDGDEPGVRMRKQDQ